MRRNVHELPALVRLASEWGIRALWVQNLSHSFGDTDPSGCYREIREYAHSEALWGQADEADLERIFAEAVVLGEELEVELRLPRLKEPVSVPRRERQPGCRWPFESAYLTHDGKVQPCCMVMGSDRSVLGDVNRQRFGEIWRGRELIRPPRRDARGSPARVRRAPLLEEIRPSTVVPKGS